MKKIIIILIFIFLIINAGCNITFTSDEEDYKNPAPEGDVIPDENNHQNEIDDEGKLQTNEEEEITTMYLYINNKKIEVTLVQNKATEALIEMLKKGDITYTARDYGGFEKVGSLPSSLPTENKQIATEPGDVILYSGNQIVIFYGTNSWSYTRLGKINGYSVEELKVLLDAGSGSTQITISLN